MTSIQVVAIVASIAVVLGALPLITRALAQSRRDRRLRTVVRLPFIAVVSFAALSAVLILIAHSQPPWPAGHATTFGHGAFIAWLLAGAASGTVCVLASRRALFAIPVSGRRPLAAQLTPIAAGARSRESRRSRSAGRFMPTEFDLPPTYDEFVTIVEG